MGESACLMQPFSYAAPQGDSLGALGQSVSFGRFMSEKLDWKKWSSFPTQNRYVAEAERYSRPGSVAQKKAFFEAHYKKLAAARKAAAEEALLLRQLTSDELVPVQEDINGVGKKESDPVLEIPRASLDAEMKVVAEKVSRSGNRQSDEKENRGKDKSEINGKGSTVKKEQQVEEKTPMILKKKKYKEAQPKSSTKPRVSKLNISERTPSQKPSSNKSSSYNFTPAKEFNRLVLMGQQELLLLLSYKPKNAKLLSGHHKAIIRCLQRELWRTLCSPHLCLVTEGVKSKCRAHDSSTKTGRGRWNFLPAGAIRKWSWRRVRRRMKMRSLRS
ncbi:hypothetical protein HID58_013572 [Brassica napus]|uniref:TPX2 C-terminal domain-containing protein n=1 Tax=Brassica napus TaxID=3708 RepID=A0ABQ8E497_BRANA|nr:hypothetical protein HID58_013572 [Brassica napus]